MPEQTKVDVFSPASATIAFRAFNNIAKIWQLSAAEQAALLGLSKPTFYRWRRGKIPRPKPDVVERLSYLLGIYKALRTLFPADEDTARWIRAANSAPMFNGRSALDRMLDGSVRDLQVVRRYLDAQCHNPW